MTYERRDIGYQNKGKGLWRRLKRRKPKKKRQTDVFLRYIEHAIGVKIRNADSQKRKLEVKLRIGKEGTS